jgi:hypothetical protein
MDEQDQTNTQVADETQQDVIDTTQTQDNADTTPTPEQLEITRLKEENERLKNTPTPVAQTHTAKVTSATLNSYTSEQWAQIESETGKDKQTIMREFRDYEITQRQNEIEAKAQVNDALQDELEKNPKLLKMRGSIKEFLNEIPLSDKIDPVKLKRAMEKAIIYARGKHITMTQDNQNSSANRNNKTNTPSPKIDNNDNDNEDGYKEGEIKNDVYTGEHGVKIKIGKLDKKIWDRVQHKTREPNSLCIPSDFDEKPRFGSK